MLLTYIKKHWSSKQINRRIKIKWLNYKFKHNNLYLVDYYQIHTTYYAQNNKF
jgi:hypothetical protein